MKITLPPKEGIVGESALREAKVGELGQVVGLLESTFRSQFPNVDMYPRAVYADRLVVRHQGRDWAYPYAIDDNNQVTIGAPSEVVMDHVPVRMVESIFVEAKVEAEAKPGRYLVRVIRSGVSENRVNYPASVLREAVSLFNGVRVFSKSDDEHIKGGRNGKDFRQLVGRLVEAKWVATQGGGEIHATLEVLDASDVADKLREAVSRDMTDLFGLSIDAQGTSKQSGKFKEATKLIKVESVDLIIEPGAGGQIIRFIEAVHHQEPDMLRQQMIAHIVSLIPALAAQLVAASDEQVLTAYREACASPAPTVVGVTPDQLQETMRMVEAKSNMRLTIGASKLPKAAQERLIAQFAKLDRFAEADVTAAIEDERKYLSRFVEAGKISGLGEVRVEPGEDRSEKVKSMLDNFFDLSKKPTSFREAYVEITGDIRVTGSMKNCDRTRMVEALGADNFREAIDSTTFADVLGDSIARRMIADYQQNDRYDAWRQLASVTSVNDFRTQERTRMGGYGDLPAVAEAGPYDALNSPGDEKATYAVTKRGGTETITVETIRNDDVGVIRRIPMSLAKAAKRTLSKFALDFLRTNPAIYDTLALFVAGHNNIGTTALSAATLSAGRLAVMKQTEAGSSDRLGIPPSKLFVPADLEEAAFELFRRTTNNDTDFVESLQMKVVPVWYWTDTNNWYLACDQNEVPGVEIAFLDGNEEPELFVQDAPTQGSLFSNDQIKYKIRHIYGGNVLDYRGLYGGIVA